MFCSNCGKEIPDGSEFCPYCGTNLNEEIKKEKTEVVEEVKENICNNCKKEIPEESDFCPYCGYNLKDNIFSSNIEKDSIVYKNEIETTTKPPMKSKVVIITIVIVGILTIAFYNISKIYKKVNNLNGFFDKLGIINNDKKENNETKNTESISNKTDTDNISNAYKNILKEYINKGKDNDFYSVDYALVDIDDDNTKELVIMAGKSNADYKFYFYTFKNNEAINLGSNDCGASSLYKMKESGYLKQVYIHGGGEIVWDITYKNDEFKVKKVKERTLNLAEEVDGDFTTGDKYIEFYESSDTKEIEKL